VSCSTRPSEVMVLVVIVLAATLSNYLRSRRMHAGRYDPMAGHCGTTDELMSEPGKGGSSSVQQNDKISYNPTDRIKL